MTVKEIIEQYLAKHGFDGLAGDGCGCQLSDLMPCEGTASGNDISGCVPGYKVPCDPETCEADGDCDFHISEVKK
jgi:hypothetical protein